MSIDKALVDRLAFEAGVSVYERPSEENIARLVALVAEEAAKVADETARDMVEDAAYGANTAAAAIRAAFGSTT